MSFLVNEFRNKMNKSKDISMRESVMQVGYSTGFLNLDYKNGLRVACEDIETEELIMEYDSIGVSDGGIYMFVGNSGTGKSSLVMKIASNITDRFDESCIIYEDAEGTTTPSRFQMISGWSAKKVHNKFIHRDSGVTTQNVFQRIKDHADMKLAHAEELTYDTKLLDPFGMKIQKLVPTIIIIDSWIVMMPETQMESEELAGNTAGMTQARVGSDFIKQVRPICKKANILLFIINHIREKKQISMFDHKQAQVNYLNNKYIPGGDVAVYLANGIYNIIYQGGFKTIDKYGFDGFLARIEFIKSKTSKAGQSVNLVYNQVSGYDNIYGLLHLLNESDLIGGQGVSSYLSNLPTVKFDMRKNFMDVYNANPILRLKFKELLIPVLESYVVPWYEADKAAKKDEAMIRQLEREGVFK